MISKNKTQDSGLNKNTLGLFESIIMGIAGSAPAFSLAATLSVLIGTVGLLSPASLLYSSLIMIGITLAFKHMNRVNPNSGASYAWVSQIFHPILGFLAGWSLLVASAIFMVAGTIPAATMTLTLISPERVKDLTSVTLVAAGWLSIVCAILIKGIKLTSYTQVLLTLVEVGIIIFIMVSAFLHFSGRPAAPFDWSLLSLTSFTPLSFANGAIIALFFYWGWDVTLNLNEETKEAKSTPGIGAFLAMIIISLIFVGFSIATLLAMPFSEIQEAGTNIIFVLADKIFPRPLSYIAILAVVLSTVGTLETSILQFTRTMYAKGRDGVLPSHVALLHYSWKTPWVATLIIYMFGLLFLFLSSFFPGIDVIIKDSVNAIGFQVAFYYSLTALACAWHFRHTARKSWKDFITHIGWPVFSAICLIFSAIYSIITFDLTVILIGIGSIALGLIPLGINALFYK